jgi:hypothetical protein
MSSRKCVICGKQGKRETILLDEYVLCATHNIMVELDTIDELIRLAILKDKDGDMKDFITSCQKFMNEV